MDPPKEQIYHLLEKAIPKCERKHKGSTLDYNFNSFDIFKDNTYAVYQRVVLLTYFTDSLYFNFNLCETIICAYKIKLNF